MSVTHEDPINFTKHVIYQFYKERNLKEVFNCLDTDFTWIGPAKHEYMTDKEGLIDYFHKGKERIPSCIIDFNTFTIVYTGDQNWLVLGSYDVRNANGNDMLVEVFQRSSFFIDADKDTLKVKHMHISNPFMEMTYEYYSQEVPRHSYEYLLHKLEEKNKSHRNG